MNNKILDFLPSRLLKAISEISSGGILEEIRVRKNKKAYIIKDGKNIILNIITTENEMLEILKAVTNNSLYAHRDTIVNGYISTGKGIRIGIIGSASMEKGQIIGVYDISELAIRLPNSIMVNVGEIEQYLNKGSVLIYSPPGEGKTTLLRAIIRRASIGVNAKRVCVVDTRNELFFDIEEAGALVSILRGYPRKNGIEIAVRTMNPQLIVCDEIGDTDDLRAILEIQSAGVPLIATCHGKNINDLFSRIGLRSIHEHKIFDYYIGIKRGDALDFIYSVNSWEDANAIL